MDCKMGSKYPNQNMRHLTSNFKSIPDNFNKIVQSFANPHIESFNYIVTEGLTRAVQDIPPVEFSLPSGKRVMLAIKDAVIGVPCAEGTSLYSHDTRIYPTECRLRGSTYRGKLQVQLMWSVDGKMGPIQERDVGDVPIMVKSNLCPLSKMTPKELVEHHEEAEEFGGYFIVNGNEKIIRMLILPRRNFPLVMTRSSWRKRGKLFSDYGVTVRCVKPDQSAANMVLHYLSNGTAKLMFAYRKEMFFVPLILMLKALCNYTDHEIYQELVKGNEDVSYYKGCIAVMLRQVQDEGLYNQKSVLDYIGARFRHKMFLPEWYTNEQIAEFLLNQCICVHLESKRDKFNFLVYMAKKLYAAVAGECVLESADNPMNHELLLGGHLFLMVLKEKLEFWLTSMKLAIDKKAKAVGIGYKLNLQTLTFAFRHGFDLTRSMEYLLATGTVITKTGLALMQTTGLTVLADKLNYLRYVSHFRCAHRGAFFAEMRTTIARKLLPESWGFICPVHTPDGTPCGLLNHLAAPCQVVTVQSRNTQLPKVLCSLGMTPYDCPSPVPYNDCYVIQLDGRILGYISKDQGASLANKLRHIKSTDNSIVPQFMEICFVPCTEYPSQYPGLFLFTTPARMMRPVQNLASNQVEYIGTFEQVYLNVSVTAKEIYPEVTTHLELEENSMLSVLANLIPLSDFNQSPRNMYQCQMGKQTMGTPAHALRYRTDNKLYRILTPQSPLFRPVAYDDYNIDNYPLGTNAIVAVISYTGYDMEDAMILNKSSFERGFAHGIVIKHDFITLRQRSRGLQTHYFSCPYVSGKPEEKYLEGKLGPDGFPPIGTLLTYGEPYYSMIDVHTEDLKVKKYNSMEDAYLEEVIIQANESGAIGIEKVCFRLRVSRNPTIGDKFASRHGQKGICSQKWPQADMPFTESGMTPDIIFNPHGFPSRMTIGMMVESMAGKSGALHALVHDASPFKFSEDDSAADYFGKLLEAAGYNYYGTERMYSGIDGRELNANIFFGLVYYQRLRHMVADKYQVRTTGPVDVLTHQPVKGRKRAGGIRFGEMERDSLLAHGVSYLLQDRLFNCSDRSLDYVCAQCGGLLSPILSVPKDATTRDAAQRWTCSTCMTGDHIQLMALPYVFRFLAAELASVNIRVILDIK